MHGKTQNVRNDQASAANTTMEAYSASTSSVSDKSTQGSIKTVETEKTQRNYSGTGFAERMADTADGFVSQRTGVRAAGQNAAKKALYDLNPLEPVSRKRLEVQRQIMKEKEFYIKMRMCTRL